MRRKYTINYFQYHGVRCVAMSCGGDSFSPDGAYVFARDSVKPMKGKYTINDIQCADNHNYFQFKLKDKGRSAGSAATQVHFCGETLVLSQLLLRHAAVHCYGGRCPCYAAPQVLFVV